MSTSPYNEAGRLLNQIITQHKSLKTLAFSKNKSKTPCSKVAYAQVCHTLQHKSILESILNHDEGRLRKDIQAEEVRNKGLLYILLFELLFGINGSIRGGGRLKRNIMKYEKELRKTKDEILKKSGAFDSMVEKTFVFPRYIRINTLKTTLKEVVETLQKNIQESHGDKSERDEDEMTQHIFSDPHVPDLLIISPETSIQWHEHELVTSGKIILQDKSSCFSALALVHGNCSDGRPEGDYIDACAAPGNKTSHLAALIHKRQVRLLATSNKKKESKTGQNKIFAFDRASNRIAILRDQMSRLVPLSPLDNQSKDKSEERYKPPPEVLTLHEDFLKVDPKAKTYKKVRCILLDPSCSGSGIIDTPDRLLHPSDTGKSNGDQNDEKRIETLSNFQLLMLKHAMSFPQVQRIVYSTCSVHEMENEHVVVSALNEANGQIEEDAMKWTIVSPFALQDWKRRGRVVPGLTESQANSLVRVDGRDGDDTNGFFVSYFERKESSEKVTKETSLAESLITLSPDVKSFYGGEFKKQSKAIVSNEVNSSKELVKEVSPVVVENQNKTNIGKRVASKDSVKKKSESKMAKKRAKKIMWKRRQKQSKMLRLKKKETIAESS